MHIMEGGGGFGDVPVAVEIGEQALPALSL